VSSDEGTQSYEPVASLDVDRLALAMYRASVTIPRGTSKPAWRRTVEAVADAYARLGETPS
jgi:hypothetical protein